MSISFIKRCCMCSGVQDLSEPVPSVEEFIVSWFGYESKKLEQVHRLGLRTYGRLIRLLKPSVLRVGIVCEYWEATEAISTDLSDVYASNEDRLEYLSMALVEHIVYPMEPRLDRDALGLYRYLSLYKSLMKYNGDLLVTEKELEPLLVNYGSTWESLSRDGLIKRDVMGNYDWVDNIIPTLILKVPSLVLNYYRVISTKGVLTSTK